MGIERRKKEKIAREPKPNKCEICGCGGRICFDHNHKTGEFRGWICNNCNICLGMAKDSSLLLQKLIEYIDSHQ